MDKGCFIYHLNSVMDRLKFNLDLKMRVYQTAIMMSDSEIFKILEDIEFNDSVLAVILGNGFIEIKAINR